MADITLDIVELLLTTHIFNKYSELEISDLPKNVRKNYWNREKRTVPRPLSVSNSDIEKLFEIKELKGEIRSLPFIDANERDFRIRLTAFEVAAEWFEKREGALEKIAHNPCLAYYYEKKKLEGANYADARSKIRPKEVDREWIESLINAIAAEEGGDDMLKLVHIKAPEDIVQPLKDLVLTKEQESEVEKIVKAIQYRDYLNKIGLYDIGKILMVGPPGTGKTSVARAMSERLAIPFVEVKLSMITDQYLGETAKNIDRVFALAKRLNPCILFIDEFDFVAKTRTSDEHAALKRAVNTLLKAIDDISLTRDGVLLMAATNHPRMLDSAAWRRFDEIMNFPLPDEEMRIRILDIITKPIPGVFDNSEIAALTEGYSGSDLRMVIRESVLTALIEERTELTQQDMLNAVDAFNERAVMKTDEYSDQV
ncbi:MAG: VCP-like ATPase [Methanomethylovorans sp. PtaU1.Bin093]|jgi:SpoVK/Ycf46/Vps4 family AAA+-type ATPase|uniref:ATP-binding protein n=1 Tax=Methanomethylovorans sp. PtaU1.Bin093 TaxID=1811679 RepID=UPI0009C58C39|nr:ATP-binding protein [Methanomethylovorans sp. PtaU1.Bin093]OPY21426.1 MAG: VCP-like ATPase [Methanomethylovorans sp. PtaU1.Bin093]